LEILTQMDHMEVHLQECGLDASDSGMDPVAGSCEHGNKPSGSMTYLD
jgi:hypothetical protein